MAVFTFFLGAFLGAVSITFIIASGNLNRVNDAYERGYKEGLKAKEIKDAD